MGWHQIKQTPYTNLEEHGWIRYYHSSIICHVWAPALPYWVDQPLCHGITFYIWDHQLILMVLVETRNSHCILELSTSSVLANLPRILGWLSARAFLQAYWDTTSCISVSWYKYETCIDLITLIFLPKFLFDFFFQYLESFSHLSSEVQLLTVLGCSIDDCFRLVFPSLSRVCHK